jgi:hypothetical protein
LHFALATGQQTGRAGQQDAATTTGVLLADPYRAADIYFSARGRASSPDLPTVGVCLSKQGRQQARPADVCGAIAPQIC